MKPNAIEQIAKAKKKLSRKERKEKTEKKLIYFGNLITLAFAAFSLEQFKFVFENPVVAMNQLFGQRNSVCEPQEYDLWRRAFYQVREMLNEVPIEEAYQIIQDIKKKFDEEEKSNSQTTD